MCFHSDINILPIFKIEACKFLAPKINNQLTVVSKQLGSCLLVWGAIQGPQGDLAGAESCCHPPLSPFSSSYLSAGGLVPYHTAYCIYNSCSLPHHPVTPSFATAWGFSLLWSDEPRDSASVLWVSMISPRCCSLHYDFITHIVVVFIPFFRPSLHSLCLAISSTVQVVQPLGSVHTMADQSFARLLFFLFSPGLGLACNLGDLLG